MANASENYREEVAGRANVEDTPELLAYYDQLEKLQAGCAVDGREQDRTVAAEIRVGARAVALQRASRPRAAVGRTRDARKGRTEGGVPQ